VLLLLLPLQLLLLLPLLLAQPLLLPLHRFDVGEPREQVLMHRLAYQRLERGAPVRCIRLPSRCADARLVFHLGRGAVRPDCRHVDSGMNRPPRPDRRGGR
jgi:hypothetical protein